MTTYLYLVKCPNCEDEFFDFFDEAKEFALGRISEKPIITQTEVERNDFGECTDHCDLGTVWSWEDMMKDTATDAEPAKVIFTKDDLKDYVPEEDPEFSDDFYFDEELIEDYARRISFKNNADRKEFNRLCSEIGIFTGEDLDRFMVDQEADDGNLLDKLRAYRAELGPNFRVADSERPQRKPIPEGMTIEELVEAMEENEDTVECTKCGGLFEKAACHHNKEGFGWCCTNCEPADTLIEETEETQELATIVKDSINHLINDLGKDPWADDFADDVIADIETNYDTYVPEDIEHYNHWCDAVACEVSRQVNNQITEEVEELHDLGNTYDGGYPEDELEDAETYRNRLELCPECGDEHSYDKETGFCINCGFN